MKKTKIIASIGPASNQPDVMEQMVLSGMNCARFNFSHITDEEKEQGLSCVHEVRKRTGENIAILYDTKGPEFRSGMLENDEINLVEGKTIRVVKENVLGNEERFTVNHPQALDDLVPGNRILLENGLMVIEVVSVEADGVTCKVINGGVLGNKKSLSVPGVHLNIPFISDQDREDIIYACKHEGDYLALSFVSTKEDVLAVREILKQQHREDMLIISKIESQTGLDNIDSIIEVTDGIMIARGDLGVEISMYQLPIVQKNMIRKVREAGKFVVVATEMLESMKKSVRPTRAEVSDVANAVFDGTDAVMLSGETTMGKFPVDTVRNMAEVCEMAEANLDYDSQIRPIKMDTMRDAISSSVVTSANLLNCKEIVAATISGDSARHISTLRPKSIIIAACTSFGTATKLALNFGVYSRIVPIYDTTDEVLDVCVKEAHSFMKLEKGDHFIIVGGFPRNSATNFMKIEEVNE